MTVGARVGRGPEETMRNRLLLVVGVVGMLGSLAGCKAHSSLSYQSCVFDSDCANVNDQCLPVQRNGVTARICSAPCSGLAGAFCPNDGFGNPGRCVSFNGGSTFNCFQACASSAVCDTGLTCVLESGVGSAQICLPGGSGVGPVCGNGVCESGETSASCPGDCRTGPVCGNGVCESGETVTSCPGDCRSSTVPAYSGCAAGMICQAGTACSTVKNVTTIELCTVTHCNSDADCPRDRRGGNGLCISLDGDSFGTCVERCNSTADCTYPAAETCVTRTAMGVALPVPACLP
jgi:hypothetical protein